MTGATPAGATFVGATEAVVATVVADHAAAVGTAEAGTAQGFVSLPWAESRGCDASVCITASPGTQLPSYASGIMIWSENSDRLLAFGKPMVIDFLSLNIPPPADLLVFNRLPG